MNKEEIVEKISEEIWGIIEKNTANIKNNNEAWKECYYEAIVDLEDTANRKRNSIKELNEAGSNHSALLEERYWAALRYCIDHLKNLITWNRLEEPGNVK